MISHNLDTREKLPICERLEAWANVSLSQDRARDLRKAKAAIEALYEAGNALIADVRRRYPGEELRCEYMRALDTALSRVRNGGQP